MVYTYSFRVIINYLNRATRETVIELVEQHDLPHLI
jgi:hypothetical protein